MKKRQALHCLFLSVILSLGVGCRHHNAFDDLRSASDKQIKSNPADQASEQIPPDVVLGKTYDKGPVHWFDLFFNWD